MTFSNIQSITISAPAAFEPIDIGGFERAAETAQMAGSMHFLPDSASKWWGVSPAELCSAAFTIALVGPTELDRVIEVTRRGPRARPAGDVHWTSSFSEAPYAFIEDIAASFSITVNGCGPTVDAVARNFALGLGKSALRGMLDKDEWELAGFNNVDPRFSNVELSPSFIEQLLPDLQLRAVFYSVDAMIVHDERARALTMLITGDAATSDDDIAEVPRIAETTSMADLVNAMQSGQFRIVQKPQLAASTIRIWLHTLDLNLTATVADVRATLSSWQSNIDFQQAVAQRSRRYGQSHRAPPEFKRLITTPERCDEIIAAHPHRFAPMSETQESERERRWSRWVRFLQNQNFAEGPLPHFNWDHPD